MFELLATPINRHQLAASTPSREAGSCIDPVCDVIAAHGEPWLSALHDPAFRKTKVDVDPGIQQGHDQFFAQEQSAADLLLDPYRPPARAAAERAMSPSAILNGTS